MCLCCSRVPYASLLACAIGGTSAVLWGIYTDDARTDTEAIPPLNNFAATWDKVGRVFRTIKSADKSQIFPAIILIGPLPILGTC